MEIHYTSNKALGLRAQIYKVLLYIEMGFNIAKHHFR